MTRMIFVNLPVTDVDRAKAFYEAPGFTNNPQFSDEATACMALSDVIHVMLAITCDSRDEANRLADTAGHSGGTVDVNPPQDPGFMFNRSYTDPDGHIREAVWTDPAFAGGDAA